MNLIPFTDFDASDPAALTEFVDYNAAAHQEIFDTLLGVDNILIDHFPLFTDGAPDKDWLLTHDMEHKSMAIALLLDVPPDMDTVDFSDPQQTADWLNNHVIAHQDIATALGI
jgi:hypothetical protein